MKSKLYTPELAAEICKRLAAGESLRSICRGEGMPCDFTVRQWVIDDHEGFATQYARARDKGLDALAEEALAIADTPVAGVKEVEKLDREGKPYTEITRGDMIEHRRLQVDTRKWYLSKLAPKRYGERTAVEVSGPDGGPIQIDDSTRAARIAAILAAAARRSADGGDLV